MTGMIEIHLTQGLKAIIDEADVPLVAGRPWHVYCRGRRRRTLYAARMEAGQRVLMHRVILGVGPRLYVDHVNGDGLDNRRENLRVADRQQNRQNSRLDRDSRSGLKGIRLKKEGKGRSKPWEARIGVNGRQLFLGCFSDPKEAALAYDEAAVRHFGEFALTNRMMGLL